MHVPEKNDVCHAQSVLEKTIQRKRRIAQRGEMKADYFNSSTLRTESRPKIFVTSASRSSQNALAEGGIREEY
jgi:hypothetical protein